MITRGVALVVWGVLVVLLVGCIVLGATSSGRVARVGRLGHEVVRHPALRCTLALVWMWLGWHFFAR